MRLLDRLANTRFRTSLPSKAGELAMREPEEVRRKLVATPVRYVLADDVAAFCMRIMAEEPGFLRATRDIIRAPAPLLWLEWNDTMCRDLLAELGVIARARAAIGATRAGGLLESDERGRRGRLTPLWADREDEAAVEISPFAIEFDFDDPDFRLSSHAASDTIGLFVQDASALNELLGHTRFRLLAPWGAWVRANHPGAHIARLFQPVLAELTSDFPFMWAFLVALGAQNAVEKHDVDFEALNRARAKRGKPALLSHVEVRSQFGAARSHFDQASRSGHRGSPRLHFVRGHLCRRGDIVFWRSPHLRGASERGVIKNRNVHLSIARS